MTIFVLNLVFNNILKDARNMPITICVQMTFYCMNDYLAFWRKGAANAANERRFYPTQLFEN